MRQEAHIRFCVFEFGDDPSIVTKTIGLEPTKIFVKGARYKISKWEIQSLLPLSADTEEHIESLLSFLEKNIKAVKLAKEKFEAGILCAIYYYEGCNEGFHLSETIIDRLAKMNLSIDFDLYFLGNDKLEEILNEF